MLNLLTISTKRRNYEAMQYNKLTARVLNTILDSRHWKQGELAELSGIDRTVVSFHLLRERPIRDHHLVAYLRALDSRERAALLGAWLREQLPTEIARDVLKLPDLRVSEAVASWAPKLS